MNNKDLIEKYKVGTRVRKVTGDYSFNGVVIAIFLKLNETNVRVVVENPEGILHIFSPLQLEIV